MANSTSETIRSLAHELGFDQCRITRLPPHTPQAWPAASRLADFLGEGRHGTMRWMETTAPRREHPQAMWSGARSAIVLGLNYGPDTNPLQALEARSQGTISVYARGRDYHDLIKGRLKQIVGQLLARTGGEAKVFVDTAPLMEKPLAQLAGLGWQGKHTNLVSREFGSWLFLGTILTDLELEPDVPETDHCGNCAACIEICPTRAIIAPYRLDARLCISYLTIEHDGPVDAALRPLLGNRIFGCDDCLAVCPWNKFAAQSAEIAFQTRTSAFNLPLADYLALDEPAFRQMFSQSPVKRLGHARFLRNVLYAAGNSHDPCLIEPVRRFVGHTDPVIRDAAIWAVSQLNSREATPPAGT